jgi:hypothetical protein
MRIMTVAIAAILAIGFGATVSAAKRKVTPAPAVGSFEKCEQLAIERGVPDDESSIVIEPGQLIVMRSAGVHDLGRDPKLACTNSILRSHLEACSRAAGGATPGPSVQQWAADLIAHVGSDPVQQSCVPALKVGPTTRRKNVFSRRRLLAFAPRLRPWSRAVLKEAAERQQAVPHGGL